MSSTILVYSGIFTFLVDAYPTFAASALAANSFARSLFGGIFPLFGIQSKDQTCKFSSPISSLSWVAYLALHDVGRAQCPLAGSRTLICQVQGCCFLHVFLFSFCSYFSPPSENRFGALSESPSEPNLTCRYDFNGTLTASC